MFSSTYYASHSYIHSVIHPNVKYSFANTAFVKHLILVPNVIMIIH
jgi:hypothetical protein